jgi:hypothetical protein
MPQAEGCPIRIAGTFPLAAAAEAHRAMAAADGKILRIP